MSLGRRTFLGLAGTAGLVAAGATLAPRPARAAFGDVPDGEGDILLPVAERASNLLEVFLYGGLSPWETFYAVEQYGRPDDPDPALQSTQLYAFHNAGNDRLIQALSACGPLPASLFTPFAKDALGVTVNLGPFAAPLLARPDLLARMRVVVTRHDLQPHEAAIPLAITGKRLGSPVAASLGAHIQRYAVDRGDPARAAPYSYALATDFFPMDNVRATVATGIHPGRARPLLIKVNHAARLATLLSRNGLNDDVQRLNHDRLVEEYGREYADGLVFPGLPGSVRARSFDEALSANGAVANAASVRALLDPKLFVGILSTVCSDSNLNTPAMSLRLASRLLTHPVAPAAHVTVVDNGLIPSDTGGGYDGHAEHCRTHARNFRNTLDELVGIINKPGEGDAGKIDLDRTMVVLNTEFGRAPGTQGKAGRNHWPYGYVQVYLGGPITTERAGVFGAIGPDAQATVSTTPAEHRIACLLSLGIWPFSAEGFGVSDVPLAQTEREAAQLAMKHVLGFGA